MYIATHIFTLYSCYLMCSYYITTISCYNETFFLSLKHSFHKKTIFIRFFSFLFNIFMISWIDRSNWYIWIPDCHPRMNEIKKKNVKTLNVKNIFNIFFRFKTFHLFDWINNFISPPGWSYEYKIWKSLALA